MSFFSRFALAISLTASPILAEAVKPVNQFQVIPAAENFAPMLLETNSGCMWAIIPDRSKVDDETAESKTGNVSINDQLELLHMLGYYRLVPVKTAKADWCLSSFGLTNASDEKLKR